MNNVRARHHMRRAYLTFLPSGTSSNEALHAEINSWSRSTNALHRSTLALRLRYNHFIKLLLHHLATEHPMTGVVSATMMLGRSLHQSLRDDRSWATWCTEQQSDGRQSKAFLPLANARRNESELVQKWVMKKPSTRQKDVPKRRRRVTPLSVRRIHTLRSSGVKPH